MPTVRPRPNPLLLAAELLDPTPSPYVDDYAGWVRDVCGEHLWSKQVEIARSVQRHRKTAVRACHGPGKSFTAARIAAAFIANHPPGQATVVTTAPTWHQVKNILWKELRRTHRKAGLPGRINLNCEWIVNDEIVAFGRKPADHDEHGFQGIHARYLLVIVDEACGVVGQIWTAVTALMTNDDCRVLALGNPDDPNSEFAKICAGTDPQRGGMSDRGWNVIPISVFDTPNFTGEPLPEELRAFLVSPTWLDEFVANVAVPGEPLYTSKVLGQFPEDASSGTIPYSWLRRGVWGDPDEPTRPAQTADPIVDLGVDVGASDNGDATEIVERRGMRAGRIWSVRSPDPAVVRDTVVRAISETGATRVKIDATGVGWGVVTLVQEACPEVEVVGVGFADAASDPSRWRNVRAELWWMGRELSRERAWDLTDLPADKRDAVLSDLAATRYRDDSAGRIQIEDKAEVRKRLGRSPDKADALLLAFYNPQPQRTPLWIEGMDEELAAIDREQDARGAPAFGDYWDDEDEDW